MNMRTVKLLVLAALAAVLLQSCAVPPQIQVSDGVTIQREFNDRTVIGYFVDGGSYCEYHTPNGTVLGRDTEIYAGNWQVRGDFMCYAYPGQREDCQQVYVSGRSVTFYDGRGQTIARGNLADGNLCS
jgi:hypothetical protein